MGKNLTLTYNVLVMHMWMTSLWKRWKVSLLGGMRGMRLSTKREQERKQDHKIINDK